MGERVEMKVRIATVKGRKTPNVRMIYLPKSIYVLMGEPDVFVVESLDTKEKILVLRAVKKSEEQKTITKVEGEVSVVQV